MTDLRLALGTIPLGTTVDERDSFALLDRFVELGGIRLDTADNYPFWQDGCTGDESEATIGRWLAARGNRDAVVLSTKVGARPRTPGDRTLDDVEGLSAAAIRAAVEGSLKRLGTDRIDVYWAHVEDRAVPLEETVGAFGALVADGTVGVLGASNHATWRLERARRTARDLGVAPFTQVQLRHTYLQPRPGVRLPEGGHTLATPETFDYLAAEGDLTLWAYNTLMFGAYTRPDKPMQELFEHPGTTARLAVLHDVARELGVSANQVVIAWLVANGVVPIVGATRVEQVEEAVAGARLTLDDDLVARLDAPA
ncbi:aldo/keto reductase [Cellulomonas sp. H30R-01]|uniref:aldo/keto reductase n=1 Tax=Cellulomonas sp. H30R-01 TaxID=2704467 RepID=UPI00138C60B7|nr:aldo/keto reductase [Cellulomonas sp. H30R-01]QHT56931.1 aldo/keto reductase [Cellulomonas sp. H30R-01]